jgi:hypothetical protein
VNNKAITRASLCSPTWYLSKTNEFTRKIDVQGQSLSLQYEYLAILKKDVNANKYE